MSKTLLKKAFKYLTSSDYRFLIQAGRGKYDQMDDAQFLQRKYRASMGKVLPLDAPVTYNEKLQWLKLYDRKPEYTMIDTRLANTQFHRCEGC